MAIERLLDIEAYGTNDPADLYTSIVWPDPPDLRPYVYINMASTADGKIVIGEPSGTAKGVGGPTDQLLFRRLQAQCDAALVGASTLRAGNVIYPRSLPRFTVTTAGDLPLDNRFFTDSPGLATVFAPARLSSAAASRIGSAARLITVGDTEVDLAEALAWMRLEANVSTLLCEGGPTLNDQLVRGGLADALFLTIAPRIKGGPAKTIVSGQGWPIGITTDLQLISVYRDESELYLRYRLLQRK